MSNSVIALARRFSGAQKTSHEMITELVPEDSEDLEVIAQMIAEQQRRKVVSEADAIRAEERAKDDREKLKELQDQMKEVIAKRGIFSP